MKNRKDRIDLMVDLIRNECIGSQEELADRLAQEGFNVTQATLSRDLKMLKTTKVPTDRGTYIYILPDSNTLKDKLLAKGAAAMSPNFQSGFISLQISGNMAVIKTRNGYAAGLAYDIDMSQSPEILGTIPEVTQYSQCFVRMSHATKLWNFSDICFPSTKNTI